MRIWHISDTHGCHDDLIIRDDLDMVIFSGDCSNYRDPYRNQYEVEQFIKWFAKLPIKYKVMVAGNHDTSIESRLVTPEYIRSMGIIYLEHEHIVIDGIKIFGSPYSPTFGDWAFMKRRDKMHSLWQVIEDDTALIIVHGPPRGMLDLSINRENQLEMCGCLSLWKRIQSLSGIQAVAFGHIHDSKHVTNTGIRFSGKVLYSNASCVEDGKHGVIKTNGNFFLV
jgi:Icc-related predicted phosphoesterase